MKKLIAVTGLALTIMCGSALADTRGDFMNNPNAYGVITVIQGLPNGRTVNFDVPIHASLLGAQKGALPVASNGHIYATSIGYYTAQPAAAQTNILGMAHSPYAE